MTEPVCLDLSKKGSEERIKVTNNDNYPNVLSRPLSVCTNCNICGDVDVTYKVLLNKDDREPDTPYFPYLQRCLPSNEEMSLASSSPVLLVCTFCYHSLMAQWIAYETSPNNEDVDATRRIYNVVNYVCYICGVITYRNRIKSITVKDFPFLVDHPRPAGALSINGGESWRDFERMKVPLEMRKYNWIALPMPPDSNGIFGQVSSDAQKKEIGLTATLKTRSPEPMEATTNVSSAIIM
ncbi:hypothetical protein B4U80_00199 [Leptotrombidium deliense]|uniref:Uncharacterized protein n=1 Tax=Leptotrombidium deliense TaxID=299467 RepID=A0A443SWP3_9ACAR|nr:hypothetical protein B4U80_00199 [Leptotrombidium deliense]